MTLLDPTSVRAKRHLYPSKGLSRVHAGATENAGVEQGRSDGGYIGIYAPKSVYLKFFLSGCFVSLTHLYPPKSNSWLRLWSGNIGTVQQGGGKCGSRGYGTPIQY